MAVSPIPAGYHSVTPYLISADAAASIEFYKAAFNATELMRLPGTGGKVMHAEVRIGDSAVMLSDESPEMNAKSPRSYGGTPVSLMVYVEDVDALFAQAIAAGGKQIRPVQDQFYGDRAGMLEDPSGHTWTLATHVEDLTPEEIAQRMASMGPPTE